MENMPNLNVPLDSVSVFSCVRIWGCGFPTIPPICRNISVLTAPPTNSKGGIYEGFILRRAFVVSMCA